MFNEYFASVGRPDNGIVPNCNKCTAECLDSIDINELNILAAIKKLKKIIALVDPVGFHLHYLSGFSTL